MIGLGPDRTSIWGILDCRKIPRDRRYFGTRPFSFSASLTLSLKPPGITMSPGFWPGLHSPSHLASIVVVASRSAPVGFFR
jgi:hypothetical protein